MVERAGSEVWGVLWSLDTEHARTLDQQEGVPTVYNKKTVRVHLKDGTEQVTTYNSKLFLLFSCEQQQAVCH